MTSIESNTKYPLVSILISSYRQPKPLKLAIESSLNQNYPNLEVIVSDDASGNNDVQSLVTEINDPRLKLNINPKNLGISKNYRVLLFELAQGEYVTLLNGDDYFIDSNYIKAAVDIFQQNENIGLVFGGIEKEIVESGERIVDSYHDELDAIVDGNWFFINYPKGYSIPHVTSVYHRQTAIDLDFYRINTMSEDWESLLRIILNRKIGIINDAVAIKTQHKTNVTKTKELPNFRDNVAYLYVVYEHVKTLSIFDQEELDTWLNQLLKRHHIKWLIKIWYLSPEHEKKYLSYLQETEPKIYTAILLDPKYRGYRLIRKSKLLMRLVFKYIIKQESFIVDLQNY